MRGQSLHICFVLVAAATVLAVAAGLALASSPTAVAASPNAPCNSSSAQVVSCHFSDSYVDPDYCGTGQTVDVSFDGRFTVPRVASPGNGFNNSVSDGMFTNPTTGATVLVHSAYRFTGSLVAGDPEGVHTEQFAFKGAAEVIRDAHGGVIARDAGNLVVDVSFDGDEILSATIVTDDGGHSLFANGDCGVLVPALGIA